MSVLEAQRLSLGYRDGGETLTALSEVTLALRPGRLVGLTGESGAGKSTLALALTGYRAPRSALLGGGVRYGDDVLAQLDGRALRRLWGRRIALLPQDCAASLNPALRLGGQLEEALGAHAILPAPARRERASQLLERAGIERPARVMDRYPHQLSGGEQQRAALALALCCDPEVLILDEPTASLDALSQQGVLELLESLVRAGTAVLLVSHDLSLLGRVCDEIYVLYAGAIVERGPAAAVWADPFHPYTAALRAAIPSLAGGSPPRGIPGSPPLGAVSGRCGFAARCRFTVADCLAPVELVPAGAEREVRCVRAGIVRVAPDTDGAEDERANAPQRAAVASSSPAAPLLTVEHLFAHNGRTPALRDIGLTLAAGGALGVAGSSGAGKSTLLRTLIGLQCATSGTISLAGETLSPAVAARTRAQRQALQIVFQNPDATLNPRHSVATTLGRPLALFRPELSRHARREATAGVLDRVGLSGRLLERHPAELSSGQRQRVAIARALLASPRVLLLDEPTSALDVSAQAAVLALLRDLRTHDGVALIFVSHDLAVLRHVGDDLVVLEQGAIHERGTTAELLSRPPHHATRERVTVIPAPMGDER